VNINNIFVFTGPVTRNGVVILDTRGRVVVRGVLSDLDYDGDRLEHAATATRLEPRGEFVLPPR